MVTRRTILKNNKAEIGMEQIFFIMAFLFSVALFIVILFYSWGKISTPLETALNSAIPSEETSFNVTTMSGNVETGVTMFNLMFPLLIVGLIVMSLIMAYLSKSHPVFLFFSILLLVIAILLGVVFSNVFQQITETSDFASSAENFKVTQLFMKNFPVIIAIIMVMTIVILFSLGRSGTIGGGTGGL